MVRQAKARSGRCRLSLTSKRMRTRCRSEWRQDCRRASRSTPAMCSQGMEESQQRRDRNRSGHRGRPLVPRRDDGGARRAAAPHAAVHRRQGSGGGPDDQVASVRSGAGPAARLRQRAASKRGGCFRGRCYFASRIFALTRIHVRRDSPADVCSAAVTTVFPGAMRTVEFAVNFKVLGGKNSEAALSGAPCQLFLGPTGSIRF